MTVETWCSDTSVYTHLARAGHLSILRDLATPKVVIPREVDIEIERGRDSYPDIPQASLEAWISVETIASVEELVTFLEVLGAMGGDETKHAGESAVIALSQHRGYVALLDERAAVHEAMRREVATHDTLWLVVEAHCVLERYRARDVAEGVVDDLLATEMRLPVEDGSSLFAWAYREGYLPRDGC